MMQESRIRAAVGQRARLLVGGDSLEAGLVGFQLVDVVLLAVAVSVEQRIRRLEVRRGLVLAHVTASLPRRGIRRGGLQSASHLSKPA